METEDPAGFWDDPNEFRSYLMGYAVKLCKCPYTAEDLVQDTLFKADRAIKRGKYQHGSNIRTWLCVILRNVHISRWKREHKLTSILEDIIHQHPHSYEDNPLNSLNLKALLDALRIEIPMETHYKVLVMSLVQEYEYKDIAEILGIPMGTVMSSLFRARKNAQRFLLNDPTYKEEIREHRNPK